MAFLQTIKKRFWGVQEKAPESAYNIWANTYDSQPNNLILALDEAMFSSLITSSNFTNKIIADIGCGTGRHWKKIFAIRPAQLCGFDVSRGMLDQLHKKYPNAVVHQINNNHLPLENGTCDFIISTLAIAHINNIQQAFAEWNRIIKDTGEIIITDYHPDNLANGGQRTFQDNGRTIAVKSNIYPISQVKASFTSLGWEICDLKEVVIDASMKHYYEKQNAGHVYEKYKGSPVIYGMHLKKKHATL
jgi:ubiquinone/menaquinone biosynthesis C-methylase UbiE